MQWALNEFDGRLAWKAGRKTFVQRVVESLALFSVSINEAIVDSIDGVRVKVNNMKHDPLAERVNNREYAREVKTLIGFWEQLKTMEQAPRHTERRYWW
jgi:hypothetical protein